jgi:uncharacterized protein YbaP (TraB family)
MRYFSRLLALCVFALVCFGSDANAATCCVWRVTSVPVPFYLVGTLHALSGNDYPLPAPYTQALRDSQRLLFEISPDPKSDFPKKFVRAAEYPKGDDIRHHVHPQTWEYLAKNFKYSDFFSQTWIIGDHPIEGVEKLRPWAVAYFLWGIRGYNDVFSSHGVDNHLSYQARRMGKEVGGIETSEEHVEVLSGMNDIESELILLDTLVRGDKRKQDYNELRAAWKKGDTAALWANNMRFRKIDPGADVRLLDIRNVKWIPRIKAEMKSGKPTSIVAGAGHFIGPNGVVSLLQKAGYKVEQL